jgi:Bacterial protein of unknown function (DUF948).
MSLTEFTLIIIAAAVCILVATLVPVLLIIKRTAFSVGSTSDMINKELKPVLQELTLLLTELKTVGGGVAEHTDDVRRFMSALGETGTRLSTINRTVGMVAGAVGGTSVWLTGAKVAGKFVLDRYLKKRGGN